MASAEPRETRSRVSKLRDIKVETLERTPVSVIKQDLEADNYHSAVFLEPKKKKAKIEHPRPRYPLREKKLAIIIKKEPMLVKVKREPVMGSSIVFTNLPVIMKPAEVRRGRGRPKKEIILPTITEYSINEQPTEQSVPLEQSMPMEQSEMLEQTEPVQPRRRGRPRKNTKMYSKVEVKKQPKKKRPQTTALDCSVRNEVFEAYQYLPPEPLCNLPYKKYREWRLAAELMNVINH